MKIRRLCAEEMTLRLISPDNILWYSFREASGTGYVKLDEREVREFPVKSLDYAGSLRSNSNLAEAARVTDLILRSQVPHEILSVAWTVKGHVAAQQNDFGAAEQCFFHSLEKLRAVRNLRNWPCLYSHEPSGASC